MRRRVRKSKSGWVGFGYHWALPFLLLVSFFNITITITNDQNGQNNLMTNCGDLYGEIAISSDLPFHGARGGDCRMCSDR